GSYTLSVTVTDSDGATASTSSTATVTDAPLSATAGNLNTTEGLNFTVFVASFSDANPFATAGDFTATITWGDGTSSAGVVSANGGGFSVSGSHTWVSSGPFAVLVAINDDGGGTASANSTANITDAPLTGTGITIAA